MVFRRRTEAPPTEIAIAHNGPRVYEPARRAQAVAPLPFCNRRERRAGCRRPSTRRVRSVNPLLYDVAGPAIFPRFATDGKAGDFLFEEALQYLIGFCILLTA